MIKATKIIIGVVIVALIAWDVVVGFNSMPNDTISEIMRRAGRRVLAVPFFFGVLLGHFWGPSLHWNIGIFGSLGIVTTLAALISTFRLFLDRDFPPWAALVAALAGVVAGMVAWPQ